ncbi:hypothetical protein [Flavobacterium sp.]|uniref:hypothetical protein n=1 Tax=Flavobacterium sp. TaxID=239 RepID=UPI00403384CB
MKLTTLTCLLLFGISGTAQSIAENKTDAVTGGRTIRTNNNSGGELKLGDSVVNDGAVFFSAGYQSAKPGSKLVETYFIELYIIHNDNRLGCLNTYDSRILLQLEDGTKIDCFQVSESDCDPVTFQAGFALMPRNGTPETMKENFEKLLTTNISGLVIVTSEKKMDFKIKKSSRDYMKKHFALIDKTVKSSTK